MLFGGKPGILKESANYGLDVSTVSRQFCCLFSKSEEDVVRNSTAVSSNQSEASSERVLVPLLGGVKKK